VLNRNRSGVAVDLRSDSGAKFVLELAGQADVLIEGFRPGVAERFGLGPDDLSTANPKLVYGRMTGWGQEGPLAARAGHDLTYLAISGALAHIGRAGQPPTPPLNLVADFGGGGMLLAFGIMAALVERGSSGLGQVVDAAMVDGAALLMAPLFGAWDWGFWSADRGTNLLDSGAPFYDVYECADGGWLAVGALEPQFYAKLLAGLGLAERSELPDQNDRDGWPILKAEFTRVIRTKTRDSWVEVFGDEDACVAPVLNMGEAPTHPHAVARSAFPVIEGVTQPGPAPRFGRTPASTPKPSFEGVDPALVLQGWGVSAEQLHVLQAEGTVT
jgi:alpha-methylacyl-CoA racemase